MLTHHSIDRIPLNMRLLILVILGVVTAVASLRSDQEFWKGLAKAELENTLKVQLNLNTAKNVILFIGDGMGPNTVTATRIYKGGETSSLSFEDFPATGLLKTYNANQMVPDSSSTATALLCGVKTNRAVVGVDATVFQNDCAATLNPEARLKSLAALALEAGKKAGFVTTMRVTHSTPGPLYAFSANRNWECEASMPAGTEACKDTARQLVEEWPGKDFSVIMGGGRQSLIPNAQGTEYDPVDAWGCSRRDGRDLLQAFRDDKASRGLRAAVVGNNQQLRDFDAENTDYLMGVFANGNMKYEFERDSGPEGSPSLPEMVEAALKVLSKSETGYFLMVEGGNIDMAHHRGRAKTAIDETAALDEAVRVALDMSDESDTLVVVTADHTQTLSINGYPARGSNIFGKDQVSEIDGIRYTTLSYSTGGPGAFHYEVQNDNNGNPRVMRTDPTNDDTESYLYEQIASIVLSENAHGGGDVAVYAKGPQSHLLSSVHEQHYLYHAISYAAGYGDYSN